jgi:hypothetical protein
MNVMSGEVDAVDQWHLGENESQGRIEVTNPITTRMQRESQSVTHVNESTYNSGNDTVLQAAQQAIMDMLQTVAVNSLRLLNTTTNAITHTIKIKMFI